MAEVRMLDAMGVLYRAGDDVAELLVPFVRNHGQAGLSAETIEREYVAASLGQIDTTTFWKGMGVDPALEDDYLAGHRLIDGTREALPRLQQRFSRIACLSNDVTDWSAKLRQRYRPGNVDRPLVHQWRPRHAQAVTRDLSSGHRAA